MLFRGFFLEVNRILAEIDAQIAKLQQARALLAGSSAAPAVKKAVGRPRKSSSTSTKATPKKRILSPEARKRIAEAQKKRWAETRKQK